MRVWQLVFVLMIITGVSLVGKGAQQVWQLFGESDNDHRIIGLADEVRGKGWIIYSASTGNSDWDLFLMRPDGSGRRNITNTPGFNEAAARFTHDGQKVSTTSLSLMQMAQIRLYGAVSIIGPRGDLMARNLPVFP
jgi:hypothetical protein